MNIANRYERAELLTALWRLGAEDRPMPTYDGIFDRALKCKSNALPRGLIDGLSFSVTGVGLRCLDLPDILLAAQEALLILRPSPNCPQAQVKLDHEQAREIVLNHGIQPSDAVAIGRSLLAEVERLTAGEARGEERLAA